MFDAEPAALAAEIEAACHPGADARWLRLAWEALPPGARAARSALGAALAARSAPQPQAAPPSVIAAAEAPGLEAIDAVSAEPHALLEHCFETLGVVRGSAGVEFEARAGQREMAHAVLATLLERGTLVIEAGTGSGKSLAYALPAALFAWREGRRTVLATHTRTLQSQLVERELPRLWADLGLDRVVRADGRLGLRFTKLLGRSNYVCRTALERWVQAWSARGGSFEAARLVLALLQSEDGSLDALAPGCDPAHLEAVRSRRETCAGGDCREPPPCPVYAARERARAADVVVVNHALLCIDGRLEGTLLGDADALVVDEAHDLDKVATEAFSHRLGSVQGESVVLATRRLEAELRRVPVNDATAAMQQALPPLLQASNALRGSLQRLLATLDAALPRAARVRVRQRYRDPDEVFAHAREAVQDLHETLLQAASAAAAFESAALAAAVGEPATATVVELAGLVVALQQEVGDTLDFLTRDTCEDWVHHLDFGGPESALREIVAAPLDVGPALQRMLAQPERAIIYTSATLFVDGEAAHVRRRLGLPQAVAQQAIPSPFDFARQCTVVRTADLGDYRDPEFTTQLAGLVEAVHQRTRRRMLVLLTAHSMLRALHAELRSRLGEAAPLLAQGITADRDTLVSRLTATPGAILLGTDSFWEGVDFPGEALEILVLAKLPFAPPDEPLVAARCERLAALGENAFADYLLPQAVLRFRQGFGRLIRTRHDRGAVVLVDSRIETREYGESFIAALPQRALRLDAVHEVVAHLAAWFDATEPRAADTTRLTPSAAERTMPRRRRQ